LASLKSGDDSPLLPRGGPCDQTGYSLTDDEFMAALLEAGNPTVSGQRSVTVDGQLSRAAFASTKSLQSLDTQPGAEQPITPEKRRERKTQVGGAPLPLIPRPLGGRQCALTPSKLDPPPPLCATALLLQKSECRRYWTPDERTKFHEAMRRCVQGQPDGSGASSQSVDCLAAHPAEPAPVEPAGVCRYAAGGVGC
jgi:hypothetical protein